MATQGAAIVLAAGESARFRSQCPKVLHPIVGQPMITYLTDTLRKLDLARKVVVVGYGRDQVIANLPAGFEPAVQDEQRGTGHAAAVGLKPLGDDFTGTVLILCGDVPLITEATLRRLLEVHHEEGNGGTVLTVKVDDPAGLGRIVRDIDGRVRKIVEEADALPAEKAITEINTGTYAFAAGPLRRLLSQLTCDNQQGEYYLTDVIELLQTEGYTVGAVRAEEPSEVMGINHRSHLAQAEAIIRRRINAHHLKNGVTLLDPEHTYIEATVAIGRDTVIHPGVTLRGATVIGEGCELAGPTRIVDSTLGDGCRVDTSVVTGAQVGPGTTIGPFAHLRPGTVLAGGNRVGNFVETKQCRAGKRSKMSHLSYLGDIEMGEDVNIGAGTITCNYDGFNKNKTKLGDRVFIGSDTQLVAPVELGDDVTTAAGSPITGNVPAGALALARARQVNKDGWTARQRAKHKGAGNGTGKH